MTFLTRLREFAGSLALKPREPQKPVPSKPIPVGPAVTLPPTIKAANEALNALPEPLPPVTHRKTSKAGIDLMHQFEGCEKKRPDGLFEAYLCPAKVWTIGWGSTGKDPFSGGMIGKGTVWTQEQCDRRFDMHLAQFEEGVRDAVGMVPTSQAQFDAMVALAYNIGVAAFKRSTVARKHRNGDYEGAANAFGLWVKAGGKTLRGLVRRREAEAALYRSGS